MVRFRPEAPKNADVAHLVERHLAKVEVAGSSPVIRSKSKVSVTQVLFYFTEFFDEQGARRCSLATAASGGKREQSAV